MQLLINSTLNLKQFIKIGLYGLTIYREFGMIKTCWQSRWEFVCVCQRYFPLIRNIMSDRLTIISRPGGFLRWSIVGRYCWLTGPYLRSGNRPDMISRNKTVLSGCFPATKPKQKKLIYWICQSGNISIILPQFQSSTVRHTIHF